MKKTIVIVILILLGIITLLSFKGKNAKKTSPDANLENKVTQESVADDDGQLSPEEVLERMDRQESVRLPDSLDLEIVSPEGNAFQKGQARMYKGTSPNFPDNASGTCTWKFYLNQYDTEKLYEEMEGRVIQKSCTFTSTFIEDRGKLRVTLDVTVLDPITKLPLATASAERNYLVE